MTCQRPELSDLLVAWLEDALSSDDSQRLRDHVAACTSCQAEADALSRLMPRIAGAYAVQRTTPLLEICPTSDALVDRAAGTAPPERSARLETHLTICPPCRALVEALRHQEGSPEPVAALPVPQMPQGLRDAFRAAHPLADAAPASQRGQRGGGRWGLQRILAVAATFAILVGVSTLFFARPDMFGARPIESDVISRPVESRPPLPMRTGEALKGVPASQGAPRPDNALAESSYPPPAQAGAPLSAPTAARAASTDAAAEPAQRLETNDKGPPSLHHGANQPAPSRTVPPIPSSSGGGVATAGSAVASASTGDRQPLPVASKKDAAKTMRTASESSAGVSSSAGSKKAARDAAAQGRLDDEVGAVRREEAHGAAQSYQRSREAVERERLQQQEHVMQAKQQQVLAQQQQASGAQASQPPPPSVAARVDAPSAERNEGASAQRVPLRSVATAPGGPAAGSSAVFTESNGARPAPPPAPAPAAPAQIAPPASATVPLRPMQGPGGPRPLRPRSASESDTYSASKAGPGYSGGAVASEDAPVANEARVSARPAPSESSLLSRAREVVARVIGRTDARVRVSVLPTSKGALVRVFVTLPAEAAEHSAAVRRELLRALPLETERGDQVTVVSE